MKGVFSVIVLLFCSFVCLSTVTIFIVIIITAIITIIVTVIIVINSLSIYHIIYRSINLLKHSSLYLFIWLFEIQFIIHLLTFFFRVVFVVFWTDIISLSLTAVMVSGRYVIVQNGCIPPQPILMEHCCFMVEGNDWDISVKCRPHFNQSKKSKKWRNIKEVYPDAKVETKHNDIRLTLPVLGQSLEVAAFGVPGKDDQKRMQMVIFGKEPAKACDWDIRVYLIDDSEMAFKVTHLLLICILPILIFSFF